MNPNRCLRCLRLVALAGLAVSTGAPAADVVSVRTITPELATDIARGALEACREQGYQVTAVVVDRSAIPQVVLRDVKASRFTIQIAEEKANAVILAGVSSAEFRRNRADIRDEMNQVDGVLMLEGAVPVVAAGSIIGAVGVSGAPGGDRDEACARAGLARVQARLDFVE